MEQESFEIVQTKPDNQIEVSQQQDDSLFDYSKDQNSFSFQIEEEKRKSLTFELLPHQSSQKPMRNNIFQKYKKNLQPVTQELSSASSSNAMMQIFDEVFGIEEEKAKKQQPFLVRKPLSEPRQRASIFGNKQSPNINKGSLERPNNDDNDGVSIKEEYTPILSKEILESPCWKEAKKGERNFIEEMNAEDLSMIEMSSESGHMRDSLAEQILAEPLLEQSKPVLLPDLFKKSKAELEQEKESLFVLSEDQSLRRPQTLPLKEPASSNPQLKSSLCIHPPHSLVSSLQLLSSIQPLPSTLSVSPIQTTQQTNHKKNIQQIHLQSNQFSLKTIEDQQTMLVQNYLDQQTEDKKQVLIEDKSKVKSSKDIGFLKVHNDFKNIHKEDSKAPCFMQKLIKINQIYPNFESDIIESQKIEEQFQELRKEIYKVLELLNRIAEKVNQAKHEKLNYNQLTQLMKEVSEKRFEIEQSFQENNWTYDRLQKSLESYFKVVRFYKTLSLGRKIGEEDIKNYLKIRQKFWDMEINLISMAKDISSELMRCIPLPELNTLLKYSQNSPLNEGSAKQLQHIRSLYSSLWECRKRSQFFSFSEIVFIVERKLETEIKFCCPL